MLIDAPPSFSGASWTEFCEANYIDCRVQNSRGWNNHPTYLTSGNQNWLSLAARSDQGIAWDFPIWFLDGTKARAEHIRNPQNEDQPVRKGKDGQENGLVADVFFSGFGFTTSKTWGLLNILVIFQYRNEVMIQICSLFSWWCSSNQPGFEREKCSWSS